MILCKVFHVRFSIIDIPTGLHRAIEDGSKKLDRPTASYDPEKLLRSAMAVIGDLLEKYS